MTMKQYLKIFLPAVIMLMTAMGSVSCQKEDEVPPRETSNYLKKVYKMPEPEDLSSADQQEVDAIKDEYNKSTNNH